MAKMTTCPCGWTLISPVGEEDVIRHLKLHLSETHPGNSSTEEDMRKKIVNL